MELSTLTRETIQKKHESLVIDAIYSDTTSNFVTPHEPAGNEAITIRIRTLKDNVDQVFIHYRGQKIPMDKENTRGSLFSMYSHVILGIETTLNYYFSLERQDGVRIYNRSGLQTLDYLNHDFDFEIIPNFKTPDWAKGAVMYQIYVDRFYNGDHSNDVLTREYAYLGTMAKREHDWNAPVSDKDFATFYGGDLQGVIDKLDYLEGLGVEVIYFTPLFVSPSNHKYDAQDYDYIDPHIGLTLRDGGKVLPPHVSDNSRASKYIKRTTDLANLDASNQLFAYLVKLAHAKGIKVILDGVFNHSGAFHRWLNKEKIYNEAGAYQSRDSHYTGYFKWYAETWPDNIAYDGWWGHSNHPKLNYENSRELYEYILTIGKKWVSQPYNVDGWRLDVAADLGQSQDFNHQFWRDFRDSVKSANPDTLILGEHYGDCKPWLQGDQWDTIMNYDAFMEPITWFLTGMQKHSEEYDGERLNNAYLFEVAMRNNMARMSSQAIQTAMNQLSNHDHSRFLTRTNRKVGRLHTVGSHEADTGINMNIMFEAVVFMMTWVGAPTIYYGDEAGVTGWTDPDNRRTYPWGRENQVMIDLHRAAIGLRKRFSCLKTGSLEYLHNGHGILSFGRWDEQGRIAVLMNNNDYPLTVSLPVWKLDIVAGKMESLLVTGGGGFSMMACQYEVVDGFVDVYLGAHSSVVLG